jgi:hypothetical protein
MREGIDGRQDEDAIERALLLGEIAEDLGRKDCVTCTLAWYDDLEKRGLSGKDAVLFDYNRANLIAQERIGTAWQWEQPTLAREIFYLRRAVSRPEFHESYVFINDDETGLHADFERWLEKLAPEKPHSHYAHNGAKDNGDAHLKRTIMGREVVCAVTNGLSVGQEVIRCRLADGMVHAGRGS